MKVLIDTRSLQGAYHFGRLPDLPDEEKYVEAKKSIGNRLKTFLRILEKETSNKPAPSEGKLGELQSSLLKEFDTLVILTRMFFLAPEELDYIQEFVKNGGNLLMMSNHPPFNEFDNPLAEIFGFSFQSPTYPWHRGGYGLTNVISSNLLNHEITRDLNSGLIFNNSCRIELEKKGGNSILAKLPDEPAPLNNFAIAMDKPYGKESGKIVAVADSGFIGEDDTKNPGPGQIGKADNKKFITNIFMWLNHQTPIT